MNELSITNKNLTIDSREAAGMVNKEHNMLLRDIRNYISQMKQANEECANLNSPINPEDYFIESTYINSQNKEQPCYLLTKLGCEFVANKMTGVKGTAFTAVYTKKFNEIEKQNNNTKYLPISIIVKDELEIADLIAQHTGVNKGIALATAISRVENKTGESLKEYMKLLPSADHETGKFTPSELGSKLQMSAVAINKKLAELELQYKEIYTRKSKKTDENKTEKQWRLTEKGKQYAEEFPYNKNGHSGYQIKWNESVINLLSNIHKTA